MIWTRECDTGKVSFLVPNFLCPALMVNCTRGVGWSHAPAQKVLPQRTKGSDFAFLTIGKKKKEASVRRTVLVRLVEILLATAVVLLKHSDES